MTGKSLFWIAATLLTLLTTNAAFADDTNGDGPPNYLAWSGAILGGIIGIIGGIFGTVVGIRNTKGPLERAFMLRSSVAVWVLVIAFVAGMFLLPDPYRHFLWLPYGILLTIGIVVANRQQARIRSEESLNTDPR